MEERGYSIYAGNGELVPPPIKWFAPDAIALGREPKYVIEVVRDGSAQADKLRELRRLLTELLGWELLVVLDRGAHNAIAANHAGTD